MHRIFLLLCVVAGTQASGQEIITPEEYLRDATGKTITYRALENDALLGEEQYLGGGRVIWKPAGGACVEETVTIDGPAMCSRYKRLRDGACWWPFKIDGRFMARSANFAGGFAYRSKETRTPLNCETAPTSKRIGWRSLFYLINLSTGSERDRAAS